MNQFGFNFKKIFFFKNYFKFRRNKKEWIKQGGKITHNYMILSDFDSNAGSASGHYFHQDLLVSNFIHKNKPKRHIDIASRIDGFVAHVASFREIEVVDIRSLKKSVHKNIKFIQADFMSMRDLGTADSVSCLHAIEHFGLGRYSDVIDIDGHKKGITNLVNLVDNGGCLYISFPIGKNNEIHFNAHRVFKVDTILEHPDIKEKMRLLRFDYVDDNGDLNTNENIHEINKDLDYGCGIYTFIKE